MADDITGTGHGKGRDRHAARQRLEKNQAEGIGAARKHEDIGGGISLRKLFARARAEKDRIRIGPLESRARRSVADDNLGPGKIETEKGIEILLDRDATDREEDRARQAEISRARMKQAGVDAARP